MNAIIKTGHSMFGPSSLERRLLCPGSYKAEQDMLTAGYKGTGENENSARGTDLHKITADCIRGIVGGKGPHADLEPARLAGLALAALPEDDRSAVQRCLLEFQIAYEAARKSHGAAVTVLVEHTLNLAWIHPAIDHGTADLIILCGWPQAHGFAYIKDWKFGRNPVTPAQKNIQLATYALGVAHDFKCASVNAAIAQPALEAYTDFTYEHLGLAEVGCISKVIFAALEQDAPRIAGPTQCRYCKAAGNCKTLAESSALPTVRPVQELTPADKARYLGVAPLVKKWLESLEAQALADAQAGIEIPGYEIGETRRTREWMDPLAAAKTLNELAANLKKPSDCITRTETASPAQIEAAWGKSKKVCEALDPLINLRPGKPTLKRAKEQQPALTE